MGGEARVATCLSGQPLLRSKGLPKAGIAGFRTMVSGRYSTRPLLTIMGVSVQASKWVSVLLIYSTAKS